MWVFGAFPLLACVAGFTAGAAGGVGAAGGGAGAGATVAVAEAAAGGVFVAGDGVDVTGFGAGAADAAGTVDGTTCSLMVDTDVCVTVPVADSVAVDAAVSGIGSTASADACESYGRPRN